LIECVAFTGGGTGGHVFPGLAVAERLRELRDVRIVWIGSGRAVEREAVEAAGIEFRAVPSGKLRRSLSPRNVADVFRVAAGYIASRRILRELRPGLLFSKGGYVSVPPCMAAASLGIPVFTHESDVSPGLATRLNARRAERILLSWDATVPLLPPSWRDRAVVTGNPVRAGITAGDRARGHRWLGFEPGLPVVLVLGGSQGARQVNELVAAALPSLRGRALVAHQTGPGNPPCRPADDGYRGFEFVASEMPDLMAAADIVVGRAGAGTVCESAATGKPMVLVPLIAGSRGDQVENASLLSEAGGAIHLAGDLASPAGLLAALDRLLSSDELRAGMAVAARAALKPDAALRIAEMICTRLDGGERKNT